VDPDGYTWMVGTHRTDPSAKEMKEKMVEQMKHMQQKPTEVAA